MGFLTTVAFGMMVGGLAKWQLDRRRQHRGNAWLTETAYHPQALALREPETVETDRDSATAVDTAAIVLERLERIQGITPALAYRLNRAGLLRYVDLAGQSPARLQAIVAPYELTAEQAQIWQSQALALAGGTTHNA